MKETVSDKSNDPAIVKPRNSTAQQVNVPSHVQSLYLV